MVSGKTIKHVLQFEAGIENFNVKNLKTPGSGSGIQFTGAEKKESLIFYSKAYNQLEPMRQRIEHRNNFDFLRLLFASFF